MANILPPGLAGYVQADQLGQQSTANNLAMLSRVAQLRQLAQTAPLQRQLLQAQIDQLPLNSALNRIKIHSMLSDISAKADQRDATTRLADVLSNSQYARNTGSAPPDLLAQNDPQAIAAVKAADAQGIPYTADVNNPANIQSLAIRANPASAITQFIKNQSPDKAQLDPLSKVIAARDRLAQMNPNSPVLAQYDDYIKKITTPQAAVNVYSGSLVPGVDASGKPIFVQPSGRADVPPRPVEGVFPPAKATEVKQQQKDAAALRSATNINSTIDALIAQVTKDPSVVGVRGQANKIIEGVTGQIPGMGEVVSPDAQNFSSNLSLLQSTIYKDLVGGGQISASDYKHLGEIMRGTGFLDTPDSTIAALNRVRDFVNSKTGYKSEQKAKAEDFFRKQ